MRAIIVILVFAISLAAQESPRPRAREAGIVVGVIPPGRPTPSAMSPA